MSRELESKIKKLNKKLKIPVQNVREIWTQNVPSLKEDVNNLEFILHLLKKNDVKIKPKNKTVASDKITCDEVDSDSSLKATKPKKRGRPPKSSTLSQDRLGSGSSESISLDSSTSSTSNRSRRAAAQAADQKLAQVQSFIKATKLRRPTDFDEKKIKSSSIVSSPPAKCRKTHQNSAGMSPQEVLNSEVEEDEIFEKESVVNKTYSNINRVKSRSLGRLLLLPQECWVDLTRINTPDIKHYTSTAKSRSLERPLKRKSEDLFDDSFPLSAVINKEHGTENMKNIEPEKNLVASTDDLNSKNKEGRRKKLKSKKDPDSGISSNGEVNEVGKENLPVAHSSPIPCEFPLSDEFRGFGFVPDDADVIEKQTLLKENNFTKVDNINTNPTNTEVYESVKCVETEHRVTRKTVGRNKHDECNEIAEIEVSSVKSRTKVLRTTRKLEKQKIENEQENKEDHSTDDDDLPAIRSRTRVIKKAVQASEVDTKTDLEVQVNGEVKTEVTSESEDKSPEANVRSRTKTIRKKTLQSDSGEEESNLRSRTKTVKKGVQANDVIEDIHLKYLASEFKEPHVLNNKQNKTNVSELSKSPGVLRGEVVKKRVEDFEKLKTGLQVEEEAVGRCTRNTAKNKTLSATEPQTSKRNQGPKQLAPRVKKARPKRVVLSKGTLANRNEDKENIPNIKLVASANKVLDSGKSTPLGTNKITPNVISSTRNAAVNKVLSSPDAETATAVVLKQAPKEAERKKREENRLRREAKEEEAKKKKEIALKVTTETRRRKREEQFNKVTAKKEAAEKEKALAAAKAEKEKEEKMRLIAAEKEKAREEHLKKKLLLQQKVQEHEERRKQEEAARLAKLKEQEEEYKRALAMKEREQEIQKLQKATELKSADAEKTKNQNSKLAKLAAINNAKLLAQQGKSPVTSSKANPPVQSYELTPARDDRPLLKSKTDNDYGIDDANSSDSSDDESRPKKAIPQWAQSQNRSLMLLTHKYVPKEMWTLFMHADRRPDINKLFAGNAIRKRVRTSSAVWNTPPQL